jgi:hypothetical protein
MAAKVIEDCGKLKHVRNPLVDWILLEGPNAEAVDFAPSLLELLEDLRELKSRHPGMDSWQDSWFEAHALFVYETLLYIVAALLKTKSYVLLHDIFTTHYLLPEVDRFSKQFGAFTMFWTGSHLLQGALDPPGERLFSPAAELIKRQADRSDVTFQAIKEAELLIHMMSYVTTQRWYPQTV